MARLAPALTLPAHHWNFRDVSQGSAVVSYTTPAYVSLDQPRAVTLVYSSGQARPLQFVQVDATDNSTDAPVKMSIKVRDEFGTWMTFTDGSQESFYNAGSGTTRLAAQFTESRPDALGYGYYAVVRSWWADGSSLESTIVVRIPKVTDYGEFGKGWDMAGLQRLYNQGDGVHIVGDGMGLFFTQGACDPTGCAYTSPEGDFTSVRWDGYGWTRTYPDGTKVRFTAVSGNVRGRMDWAEDRFGNRTTFGYSGWQVTSITDPAGKAITFGYNGSGALSWIQDPMGRRVTTSTTGNWLWRFTDPDSVVALDLDFATTDPAQNWLRTSWSRGANRAVAGTGFDYAYDARGKLASVTAPTVLADSVNTRPVTQLRSLEAAVLPASGTGTSTTPTARVLPDSVRITATDPRGNLTRVAVDRYGAPVRVEEPLGRVTRIERNAHSQVTRQVAPSGHAVSSTWVGSQLRQVYNETTAQTVNYEYGAFDQVTRQYGDIPEVRGYYGSLGQMDSTVVVSTGKKTAYTYDTRGRVTSVTDPRGHATIYDYYYVTVDSLQNLQSISSGSGGSRATQYRYDRYGRTIRVTNPESQRDSASYDVLNRTVRTWNAAKDSTSYQYSATGLWKVTDPIGQVYQYNRNALGWVESETDPRLQTIAYRFDKNGNVRETTNRRGQKVRTTYDALNRPLTVTNVSTSAVTTYEYGPQDQWVRASNAESTDTIRYDVAGRAVGQATLRAGTWYRLSSAYNTRGQRTGLSMTAPWTRSIGYHYNALMQLDTLTELGGTKTSLQYDDDGILYGRYLPTSGGGLQQNETTPSTHVSARTIYYNPSSTAVTDSLGVAYTQDKLGRVAGRWNVSMQRGRTFNYDLAGRLTMYEDQEAVPAVGCSYVPEWDADAGYKPTVQGSQCEEGGYFPTGSAGVFTYDRVGNRTDQGAVIQAGNRLVTVGPYTMQYDNDGNLTSKTGTGLTETFFWNALGQLDSVTKNGSTTRYGYDGFGRRVRKTTSAGTLRYLYDGDNLFMELDGSGNVVREYTFYPGVDEPHSLRTGGQTYYYITERPGHVSGLVSSAGQVVNKYTYTPWGKAETVQETVANPLRYTAREYDAESGLYFYRARYYDPELGRFISEDPIRLGGGINPYVYAMNNPVSFTDPFGLNPCTTKDLSFTQDEWNRMSQEARDAIMREARDHGLGLCAGGTMILEPIHVQANPGGTSGGTGTPVPNSGRRLPSPGARNTEDGPCPAGQSCPRGGGNSGATADSATEEPLQPKTLLDCKGRVFDFALAGTAAAISTGEAWGLTFAPEPVITKAASAPAWIAAGLNIGVAARAYYFMDRCVKGYGWAW